MITSKTAFPVHEWPGLTFEEGEPGKFHVVTECPVTHVFWPAYRQLLESLSVRAGKPMEEVFPEALEFVAIDEFFKVNVYENGDRRASATMRLKIPEVGITLTLALLLGCRVEIYHCHGRKR